MHEPQADRSSRRWERCSHFRLLSQEFSQVINVSRDVWAPPTLPITRCSSSHGPGVRDLTTETLQPCPPSPAQRPERSPSLSLFSVMGVSHSVVSESLQHRGQ